MLPCQPHATQHRAPLRYKHGFDGVEQRSQRLNRVHGKVRARCRLMTHRGLTLLGVLPAFAKGDALEVVSVLSKVYISQSHIQAFLYTGMRFWLTRLLHDDCNGACVASAPTHGHALASQRTLR